MSGFEVAEGAFPLADLLAADEVFTSSSVGGDAGRRGRRQPFEHGPAAAALQAALRKQAERDVSRLIFKVAVRFRTALYRLSGGRLGGNLSRAPVLLLTVAGRKSGKRRTTPLLYSREGDTSS